MLCFLSGLSLLFSQPRIQSVPRPPLYPPTSAPARPSLLPSAQTLHLLPVLLLLGLRQHLLMFDLPNVSSSAVCIWNENIINFLQDIAAEPQCHFCSPSIFRTNIWLCPGFITITITITITTKPKVLFYNGLLMRRLSRLWVFVDKATSYFDQKWNRSVKPLSISFPQVFIKRSEEALNISFVIKIKFWLVDFGFLKKQIILVSNQNAFQVCILWLACTYSEHLRQARLPTLVRIKCRMFLEYSRYYRGGENG